MTAGFRHSLAIGAVVVGQAMMFGAGCNQRTPILDTAVLTTAPSQVTPAAPLPPDNISRIVLDPPGNLGGSSGRGTVYLDVPARDGGRVVSLRSADESVVNVTPQIVVAEGAMSANFSFTTRAVQRNVNVTITASSGERVISDYVSVWTATTSFMVYTVDLGTASGALVQRVSSDAGGHFVAGCNRDGGGLFASASGPGSAQVAFSAPRGVRLVPGVYDHAVDTGGTAGNYLYVSVMQSCPTIGRVELHEVNLLTNGIATKLWFTFEQRCLNGPRAIRGIYRLTSPGDTTATQCFRR